MARHGLEDPVIIAELFNSTEQSRLVSMVPGTYSNLCNMACACLSEWQQNALQPEQVNYVVRGAPMTEKTAALLKLLLEDTSTAKMREVVLEILRRHEPLRETIIMETINQAVADVDKAETAKEAEITPTLGDWLEEFKEKRRKEWQAVAAIRQGVIRQQLAENEKRGDPRTTESN